MRTDGNEILHIYDRVATVTAAMLAAARDARWERLVELEQDCNGLFQRLFVLEGGAPRSREFQQCKAEVIRRVLACDAEIRLLVEPRLGELRHSLEVATREQRLHHIYHGAAGRLE